MTEETMKVLLKSMIDGTEQLVDRDAYATDEEYNTAVDELLTAYLEMAHDVVLNRMYPFKSDWTDLEIPAKYHGVQVRVAAYFINKRGADGEKLHIENGTHRSYEAGDLPPSLLREVVPFVGVF